MTKPGKASFPETEDELHTVVRWVVNGHRSDPVAPIVPNEWARLVKEARRHRLLGSLLGAVDAAIVQATEDQRASLVQLVKQHVQFCLGIEHCLIGAVEVLSGNGIESYALKGIATAHLDYPDPSMREFNDADLLIPPRHMSAAISALERSGFHRDLPPRSKSWDQQYAKDITLLSESNVEIDVHRTLAPGAFGFWVDQATLVAAPERFELGGVQLVALSPAARVLHAALGLTVSESSQRLAHVVDFALAARHVAKPSEIDDLAAAMRCELILEEAHDTVTTVLGAPPTSEAGEPLRLRAAEKPSRREMLARRCYRSGGGTNTTELLSAFLAMNSIGQAAGYVRGLVRPADAYRSERRRLGRSREWPTAARELRDTIRRSI